MADVAESSPGALVPGLVIAGRYRIERPIGTGGMATIWAGMHLALNRPIAIKFIDIVGPNSARARDRFLREARVAAAVHHRNVVDIVDFGTSEAGHPFMVMELLRGQTLAARLGSGPLDIGQTVGIVARMLAGLAAVHEAGIVHRDLKPENVFLVEDADGTFPKLLDFGVSRALDPAGDLQSVLPTRENAIVGTPQYMSPEQARGLSDIDHRSDLWSVGVILFELLTGRLPFDAAAIGDVIIQIATEDPPDFRLLRPDLAGPIERVVKRAMARAPEARFESAREMRASLLEAVTKTALSMDGVGNAGPRADLTSDLPPLAPQDLIRAVGDAYEPGDSGVLDFTEHELKLPELEDAPESGLRDRPPPAPEGEPDPFVRRRAELPTITARSGTRTGPIVGGLAFALALMGIAGVVGGLVVLRQRGGPRAEIRATETVPTDITITLLDVPDGAEVRLDGARVEGSVLRVPRNGATHALEVRAADGRAWSHAHEASADAHYAVIFAPAEAVAPEVAPAELATPRAPRRAVRVPAPGTPRRTPGARGRLPQRVEPNALPLRRSPGF